MAISRLGAFRYPVPPAQLFAAAQRALPLAGIGIDSVDPAQGVIYASVSMGMMSWGEKVQVAVQDAGGGHSTVSIASSLKFGLVDWGKNAKNVDAFRRSLDGTLGVAGQPLGDGAPIGAPGPVAAPAPVAAPSAPAGAWHPDPTGRHQMRWFDGQQWTPSVSDGGVTATDPI